MLIEYLRDCPMQLMMCVHNVTTQCGSYVSPQLTCSPLSSQQLSFVRLVYGRSWVHFPSGTQNFLGALLSTHIILIINKPWIQTNTFSIIRFSLRQNFGQLKIRPVETLQIPTFFTCSDRNAYRCKLKDHFPSPIAMLFAVTQQMHTWAVRPKQHCTRGGEEGDFVPFWQKGCMVRN